LNVAVDIAEVGFKEIAKYFFKNNTSIQ
jgi:hypothetical protein